MKKKILLSFLLSLFFFATSCSSVATNLPEVKVTSLQEHYPSLIAEAKRWKKDAYLNYVDIDSPSRGGLITAEFESYTTDKASLLVTLDPENDHTSSKVYIHVNTIMFRTPIGEEDWKIDSVETMELFLAEEDIRELWLRYADRCSDLGLRHFWVDNQFVLAWVLTIFDCFESNYTNYFYLDPVSGERLELS